MEPLTGPCISCPNNWRLVLDVRISGYKIRVYDCPVWHRLEAALTLFMMCGPRLGWYGQ